MSDLTHGTYDPDDDSTKTPAQGYGEFEIKFTWRGMWRVLVELFAKSDTQGRVEAAFELEKMATGADRWSLLVETAPDDLRPLLERIAAEVPAFPMKDG